jgi:phosphoglycolate phosphatase-like HAD superfamily hydrolase
MPLSNRFIVVDKDGTLLNIKHREHLARLRSWDDFHIAQEHDTLNEMVATFCSVMREHYRLLLVTGTPERYYSQTATLLVKHGVLRYFHDVIMRPDGDKTPDAILKPRMVKDWLNRYGRFGALSLHIALVLEDRDKVVEEWRKQGVLCWQVQSGGY